MQWQTKMQCGAVVLSLLAAPLSSGFAQNGSNPRFGTGAAGQRGPRSSAASGFDSSRSNSAGRTGRPAAAETPAPGRTDAGSISTWDLQSTGSSGDSPLSTPGAPLRGGTADSFRVPQNPASGSSGTRFGEGAVSSGSGPLNQDISDVIPIDLDEEPLNYQVPADLLRPDGVVAPPIGLPAGSNPLPASGDLAGTHSGLPAPAGTPATGSSDPTATGDDATTTYRLPSDVTGSALTPWVVLLAGLFFSLCANAYFIWQAWETHARYEDLVSEIGETRSRDSNLGRRRLREAESTYEDDPPRPGYRSRDEGLSVA